MQTPVRSLKYFKNKCDLFRPTEIIGYHDVSDRCWRRNLLVTPYWWRHLNSDVPQKNKIVGHIKVVAQTLLPIEHCRWHVVTNKLYHLKKNLQQKSEKIKIQSCIFVLFLFYNEFYEIVQKAWKIKSIPTCMPLKHFEWINYFLLGTCLIFKNVSESNCF